MASSDARAFLRTLRHVFPVTFNKLNVRVTTGVVYHINLKGQYTQKCISFTRPHAVLNLNSFLWLLGSLVDSFGYQHTSKYLLLCFNTEDLE